MLQEIKDFLKDLKQQPSPKVPIIDFPQPEFDVLQLATNLQQEMETMATKMENETQEFQEVILRNRDDILRLVEALQEDKTKFEEEKVSEKNSAYWDAQHKKWRQERYERIRKACADQPAGCPVLLENDLFIDPVFAQGYLEPRPKRAKRRSRTEIEQMRKKYALRREERETYMTAEEIEKCRKRYDNFWSDTWDIKESEWQERRTWFSERLGAWIHIMENRETKKCKLKVRSYRLDETDYKGVLYFNTWHAAGVYKLESELKAMELLRSKISEEQYTKYVCTGMLLERSKRSRLFYIFRRCRPLLVFRDCDEGKKNDYHHYQYICALCVHPQGYYHGTWAGTMVPTDDIVAQLLFMRADEIGLWRRAIQHGKRDACADI